MVVKLGLSESDAKRRRGGTEAVDMQANEEADATDPASRKSLLTLSPVPGGWTPTFTAP